MLLTEGLSSERGIAWRVADSLSLRSFLDLELTESAPDTRVVADAPGDRREAGQAGQHRIPYRCYAMNNVY